MNLSELRAVLTLRGSDSKAAQLAELLKLRPLLAIGAQRYVATVREGRVA
jgi:hypothetical protein